jgi:hypothetical protein
MPVPVPSCLDLLAVLVPVPIWLILNTGIGTELSKFECRYRYFFYVDDGASADLC